MNLEPMGFCRQCPRCPGVTGEVFWDAPTKSYTVLWNRMIPRSSDPAIDTLLGLDDIVGSRFGCGYCGEEIARTAK